MAVMTKTPEDWRILGNATDTNLRRTRDPTRRARGERGRNIIPTVEEEERGVFTRDAIAALSPFSSLDFPHAKTATNQIFCEPKTLVLQTTSMSRHRLVRNLDYNGQPEAHLKAYQNPTQPITPRRTLS